MSETKKPSLDEILGTTQVKCRRIQGGKIKHQGEHKPKLIVEVLDGDHSGATANYGFLTENAVKKMQESAEYDKDNNVIVTLPEPTNLEKDGINWVVE